MSFVLKIVKYLDIPFLFTISPFIPTPSLPPHFNRKSHNSLLLIFGDFIHPLINNGCGFPLWMLSCQFHTSNFITKLKCFWCSIFCCLFFCQFFGILLVDVLLLFQKYFCFFLKKFLNLFCFNYFWWDSNIKSTIWNILKPC